MEKLTKENYYESPKVSNSSLSWLLPETGGSVEKYIYRTSFQPVEESSESMRLGTLIHKYVEKGYNADFDEIYEVVEMPSATIAGIIEEVAENPAAPLRDEILRVARSVDYYPSWKDETVINKILAEGSEYLEKLKLESTGKVIISPEEMQQLQPICSIIREKMIWNFEKKGFLDEFNMTPIHSEPDDDVEILNECAIEFEYENVECKSLIDILLVNHTRKTFCIVDLKTTSVPISIYTGYCTEEIDNPSESIVSKWVEGVMYKRNIHRQIAFYKLAAASKYPDYKFDGAYVFAVETSIPYETSLTPIYNRYIELGKRRIDCAMQYFKGILDKQYSL